MANATLLKEPIISSALGAQLAQLSDFCLAGSMRSLLLMFPLGFRGTSLSLFPRGQEGNHSLGSSPTAHSGLGRFSIAMFWNGMQALTQNYGAVTRSREGCLQLRWFNCG